jgi:uncharacterized beta-barrel protein YwiB (DUF1934 family)
MRLSFHSISDNEDKIFYETEYVIEDNEIVFVDKTCENTTNHLILLEDKIKLIRLGDVNMEMLFDLSCDTKGKYSNNIGLEFDFIVRCYNLKIQKNKILIEYNMILDEFTSSTHKIWILLH